MLCQIEGQPPAHNRKPDNAKLVAQYGGFPFQAEIMNTVFSYRRRVSPGLVPAGKMEYQSYMTRKHWSSNRFPLYFIMLRGRVNLIRDKSDPEGTVNGRRLRGTAAVWRDEYGRKFIILQKPRKTGCLASKGTKHKGSNWQPQREAEKSLSKI